jgi:hypothetical protein
MTLGQKRKKMVEEQIAAMRRSAYALLDSASKLEIMLVTEDIPDAAHIALSGSTPVVVESTGQMARGMPKVLVADYMASVGTRAVTQTDIIRDIKSKKNVRLRMTSVRRALDALEDAGDVERIRDTKAWRAVPKLRSVT